jgi:hypothetical protein
LIQLYSLGQISRATILEETSKPHLMNPKLKVSTDESGTTLHIIKHGKDSQEKFVSRQSYKDKELTITCHVPPTQSNLHVAIADLIINDVPYIEFESE